jgi:predicted aconitase
MTLALDEGERAAATGSAGPAAAMAMRIVAEAARLLGAARLVPVTSAHIDGCLYHGESGLAFAERLVEGGGKVAVPTTLNVGALDLLHPGRVRFEPEVAAKARRLMAAYEALGCAPTWTCAPYQIGHRPRCGEHVAWGESNAVAFANSVLGARTNRLGDFLDIAAAIAGRAPYCGLHLDENRRATTVIDTASISPALKASDVFYPVLGTWLGAEVGAGVAAIAGLPRDASEDRLKALGAAAASSGAVALFHVVGVTPEAPTLDAIAVPDARQIAVTPAMLREARDRLSTAAAATAVDAIAVGSPHLSLSELRALARLAEGRRFRLPFYACTGRTVLEAAEREGLGAPLRASGAELVVDTCVVVAPILPAGGGVLMTNSGKFAHYAPATTGFATLYGSLEDCVATAVAGRLTRDEAAWS